MQLSESFKTADKPQKIEAYDVRKEAERMVRRHERQIQSLRDLSGSQEAFRSAALQATETFKTELLTFLKTNNQEGLYEEMVGFVSGKVAEISGESHDQSSQN